MRTRLKMALLKHLKGNPFLAQTVANHDIPLSQVGVGDLPPDFEFEGDRYINGKICRTAGEYKVACDKLYGNY